MEYILFQLEYIYTMEYYSVAYFKTAVTLTLVLSMLLPLKPQGILGQVEAATMEPA